MTAQTNAERQARYRARQVEAQADRDANALVILAALATLSGQVQDLTRAVDNLARRVDKPSRNGAADSVDSPTSRNGGGRTRARVGDASPAPFGGRGDARYVVDEDAWTVVKAMAGHGPASVGAIRDHLEFEGHPMSLARVTSALVHLQGRREAARTPGDALVGRPDTWTLTDPDTPAALDDPPSPRAANRQDPSPTVTTH